MRRRRIIRRRRRAVRAALRTLRFVEDGLRAGGMGEAADEVYGLACGVGGGHIRV